jgi:hypothetical protein
MRMLEGRPIIFHVNLIEPEICDMLSSFWDNFPPNLKRKCIRNFTEFSHDNQACMNLALFVLWGMRNNYQPFVIAFPWKLSSLRHCNLRALVVRWLSVFTEPVWFVQAPPSYARSSGTSWPESSTQTLSTSTLISGCLWISTALQCGKYPIIKLPSARHGHRLVGVTDRLLSRWPLFYLRLERRVIG